MPFNLDLSQIIIAIINFVVLYFILKKILFVPVMKVMKDREDNIANSIKENDKKKELLDGLRVEYDNALKKREIMQEQILNETRQKANVQYSEIVKDAKEKSKSLQEEAKSKIDQERNSMLENVKKDIAALSVLIASKVTDENMNTEKNQELADKFIREVDIK